ncbi:uncharacterized protein LOC128674076 [Plodia interpunctella]|uniref:uncharacterized protein LOC128674076 n=1 Tax=Plodia interpunctella TaxID=58824 RepID=UPI002367BCFE|nr:uncharacterized protein LOC128674076 [Plodia interpunctella]
MCVFMNTYGVLCVVISQVVCNPVMNNFNTSLREFSAPEDNITSTGAVRTLQKEEFERYANFAPVRTPIKFKEIPDNTLSSSAHQSRGLLHHEHNAYGLDYDDNQHYDHGIDYHLHDAHLHDHHHLDHSYGLLGYGLHGHGLHDHHLNGHHGHHHDDHHETHLYHGDHGHDHHKHLAHALAAKTVLWPIAGIALLGAAAALVTNPVLLQLGVVSGRRKRETQGTVDIDSYSLNKWLTKNPMVIARKINEKSEKRIEDENNFEAKPVDIDTRNDKQNYKRNTKVEKRGDILKRHRETRVLNVNTRKIFRKPSAPSANPVYVNQSDLPRTESDEDKHYIAIPLLTNS